jgi:hypothetical protein
MDSFCASGDSNFAETLTLRAKEDSYSQDEADFVLRMFDRGKKLLSFRRRALLKRGNTE